MVQIGKHAMAGTPDGALAHTGNRNAESVELNLQDLHTVRNEPRRLTEWTEIALQLAEQGKLGSGL